MNKNSVFNSVKHKVVENLTRLSTKRKKMVLAGAGVLVLVVVGTVGALNGWFGGGAKIPEDTMTRGLIGYWNMDESSGPLVFDKSGNKNDGMINDGGSGNPVAYWTFDEGTGQTAYDYIGLYNGTLGITASASSDDPIWTSSGRVGGALQFDGKDDYVNVGDNANLKFGTGNMTLMAWVKTTMTGSGTIIDKLKSSMNYPGYWIRVTSGKAEGAAVDCGTGACGFGTTRHVLAGTSNINDGKWHHVAYSRNGTLQTIYVDGLAENTLTETAWDTDHTTALGMGKRAWSGGTPLDGSIDDVRIYNYARDAAQIQRDYQATYKSKYTSGAPAANGGSQGTAISLDGVDDYVGVGNVLDFERTNSFSVFAWVKRGRLDTTDQIVSKGASGGSPGTGWRFFFYTGGLGNDNLSVLLRNNGDTSNQLWVISNSTFESTTDWYLVGFTYDGSSTGEGLKLYSNGVFLTDQDYNTLTGSISNSASFNIGGLNNSASCDGLIDEVRVYNRVLSAEEIRYHYNRGGPVAYWKFDEGNGTTTYDSTNNGNDGQFLTADTSPTWTTGKYGSALSFDGTNDYVNVVNNDDFDFGSNSFTAELWVKFNVVSNGQRFVSRWQNSGGTNRMFEFDYYTDLMVVYAQSGANQLYLARSWTPVAGNWYHIVAKRDGNSWSLYSNGVQLGSPEIWAHTLNDANYRLLLGSYDGTAGLYFNGTMDDVRIYNYARSAEEIRLDYNQGLAGRFSPTDAGCDKDPAGCMDKGLVGYWDMDEQGSPILFDQSDYRNDGMINDGGSGNPVAYWTFDEGTGQTAYDLIGTTSNNGTLGSTASVDSSDPTWTSSGRVGGALQFDGVNDYVGITTLTNPVYSLSLWIKPATTITTSTPNTPIAYPGTNRNFNMGNYTGILTDETIGLSDGSGANDKRTAVIGVNITNEWHMITLSWNAGASRYDIYLDGVVQAMTAAPAGHAGLITADSNFVLGWDRGSVYGKLSIDDVRIYNYARDAAQIQRDYQATYKSKYTSGAPAANGGSQGTAISLDGVDDYVGVGDVGSVKTVEFWINNSNTTDGILELVNNATYISISSSAISLTGFTSTSTYINGVKTSTLSSGWNHVVVTADAVSAASLNIGEANSDYMGGTIDEVRVYNRVLSAEEIRYHYNRGGPVAYWKFDEGNGTTTYDSTNNNNDGQFQTAASSPVWTTGKYGSALLFDGADDYVQAPDINYTDVTVEGWFKKGTGINTQDNYYNIVNQKKDTADSGIILRVDKSGSTYYLLGAYENNNTTQVLGSATKSAVSNNVWYHGAVTYNATNNNYKLYLNGILVDSYTTTTDIPNVTTAFKIGDVANSNNEEWNGVLDDVRIYNYARTQEQILQDYNGGVATYFK